MYAIYTSHPYGILFFFLSGAALIALILLAFAEAVIKGGDNETDFSDSNGRANAVHDCGGKCDCSDKLREITLNNPRRRHNDGGTMHNDL